jgi:hypothetical protein
MKACVLTAMLTVGMLASCGGTDDTVTFQTMLNEMIDRESIAQYPAPDFRLRQQSSYHRDSVTPADTAGWFANTDRGHFIRTEENSGRQEWVLMDHTGAGAMTRSWMPDPRITPMVLSGRRPAPDDLGTLRVYLDGNPEPALEGPTYDLLNGDTIFGYPFGHKSKSSAVSYFPFTWAQSCKITMDIEPQYYIFTYREYAEGTPVKTFTMDDLAAAKSEMARIGKTLTNPVGTVAVGAEERVPARINPQDEVTITLPEGPHAIRNLSVKLGDYSDSQVTRSLVVKIAFDGEQTVWCPVGDFFGTGVGLHPFEGWYRTVAADGLMSARWIMPYQKSAVVSLVNLDDQPIQAELTVGTGGWTWDDRSMYFHAGWRRSPDMPTMPRSDWNYIRLRGRGVYVGDALTIWNPMKIWWGEGDAKIWVDGEDFPSIFGTGTEDYYAYSYGGQNRGFYEHPFHAQVRVMNFDQNTKGEVPIIRITQGYSTETRTRAIDGMPFGESLQLDMEVWHWKECKVNYNVACYWYGLPGATSNRSPMPEQAKEPVMVQPTNVTEL